MRAGHKFVGDEKVRTSVQSAGRWARTEESVVMLPNREGLNNPRKQPFVEGVSWPVKRASLYALLDMGLTVEQIARYFSVDPVEVRAFLKPGR